MMFGYGFSWIFMGLMMIFSLLVTVGVILLIVWLVRVGTGTQMRQYPPAQDEALEVARRRYASGEITKEQYDEIIATLRR